MSTASALTHGDYRISIICALPFEYAAVRAVLDEIHPQLAIPERDPNIYTLGRVGIHNVVVVSSTDAHGCSKAIIWQLSSFTQIRFGLLVGVGSGVPSINDIRLGDVVVSDPLAWKTFQYDISTSGVFTEISSTSTSSCYVLSAIGMELADADLNPRGLLSLLGSSIGGNSMLKNSFASPGYENDRLFRSDYQHEGPTGCSQCNVEKIISRHYRETQEPQIHYGSIASGMRVIQDARLRDRLSEQLGHPLCVETEAVGLMDGFPCVVIRGICDYADSHRNKDWQRYAALTAALYAKRLLQYIPDGRVDNEVRAVDILDLDLSSADGDILKEEHEDDISITSSTVVGNLDSQLLSTALTEVVESLATEIHLKSLCTAAFLRMEMSVLRRHLSRRLISLAHSMRKGENSSLSRAISWLLRRHMSYVTFSLCEKLNSSQGNAQNTHLPVETLGSARKQQLARFIDERFPVHAASTDQLQAADALDDSTGPSHMPEQDEIDEDAPQPEDLTAVDRFKQTLCGVWQYYEALKQLKEDIFPPAIELIRKVLERHCVRTKKVHSISCRIDWQLLDYLIYEGLPFNELETRFTINGKPECCSAARLGDYIYSVWSSSQLFNNLSEIFNRSYGPDDISAIQPLLREDYLAPYIATIDDCSVQLYYTDHESHFTRSVVVVLTGSLDKITVLLEQFAWLTATLRRSVESELTVSEILFQADEPHSQSNSTRSDEALAPDLECFNMSIRNLETSLRVNTKEQGQCWSRLFTESILAYGFPTFGPDRPASAVGLEIPFEIMAAFAGRLSPVMFEQRLSFANESLILIPQCFMDQSIQWHVEDMEDLRRRREQGKPVEGSIDPLLETLDITNITSSRAFFGYCKFCEVLPGTKEFSEVQALESEVPSDGPKLMVKLEGNLAVAVNAHGYGSLTAGTTWSFSRGERAFIQAPDLEMQERIARARTTSILLYDQMTQTAFLLSELSVVLQMTITYLRQNTDLESSLYPFATLQGDGGKAAYDAVMSAKNLDIPEHTGDSRKLLAIVDSYLKLLEQRKNQASIRRDGFSEIGWSVGLKGWDYNDIQTKSYEMRSRRLLISNRPIWWQLFKKTRILVLFTRVGIAPVRPSLQNHDQEPKCQAWSDCPPNHHILVAPVAQLEHLKAELCKKTSLYPTRYMITDEIAWARPKTSRLFESTCRNGGTCNPVQTMMHVASNNPTPKYAIRKLKAKLKGFDNQFEQNPGAMEPEGAVLFADDPRSLERRPCQLVIPRQQQPAAPEEIAAIPEHIRWPLKHLVACLVLAFAIAAAINFI